MSCWSWHSVCCPTSGVDACGCADVIGSSKQSCIPARTSCPMCPERRWLGPDRLASGRQVGLQLAASIDLLLGCCWRLSMSQSLRVVSAAVVSLALVLPQGCADLSTNPRWVHRLCVWGLSASRMADGPLVYSEMSAGHDAGRAQSRGHDAGRAQNPGRHTGRALHRSCRRSRSHLFSRPEAEE